MLRTCGSVTLNSSSSFIHYAGITLVDETPEGEGNSSSSSQPQPKQQLAEGLKFAYDAPDKTSTDQEQVRVFSDMLQETPFAKIKLLQPHPQALPLLCFIHTIFIYAKFMFKLQCLYISFV